MIKISAIISEIVMRQPFLEEALNYGFLNLTAFAEYIQNQVEKDVEKPVSIHAIKMALSRMRIPGNISTGHQARLTKLSTRLGLSIMTLVRSPRSIDLVTNFMVEGKKDTKGFFTMIEGLHEIDIIFETSDMGILQEKFPNNIQI